MILIPYVPAKYKDLWSPEKSSLWTPSRRFHYHWSVMKGRSFIVHEDLDVNLECNFVTQPYQCVSLVASVCIL